MSSMMSCGARESTVHPTLCAVPRISLTVPCNSRAIERCRIVRAIAKISSNVMLPLCFTTTKQISFKHLVTQSLLRCSPFFTFFLSLGGSFSALMISEAADGTTEIVACLFWIVRHTVIFNPFQSPVALAISSPTFLGD